MRIKIYWADEREGKRAGWLMKRLLKKAIRGTLLHENFTQDVILSVTFTDNEGIREKNREFRDIDAPTDVLSFPMYDIENGEMPDPDCAAELGDIVLSLERAAEQAVEFGHSFQRECAFLTVHSMLHLLGYDHVDSEEEDEEMRAHQRAIMTKIGIERDAK
jgi:probable rRNA maturation factor